MNDYIVEAQPVISFCIPVYNRAEVAAKIVKGLLVSDDARFDVVISDNASSDDTREVIAGIHDARLKYYRNDTNIGAKLNWLKALELGQGKYLYLGIGRDRLHGEKVTALIEMLESAREHDITLFKDKVERIDFQIYDGIDAMIRFLSWHHPTGIVFEREVFRAIPDKRLYFETADVYPEAYLEYLSLINHKGAMLHSGVWSGESLIDIAKVRSTFEECNVSEIPYSPFRRTMQFFELIDMLDGTPSEILSDSDKDKFFSVRFMSLLNAVSIEWSGLCRSDQHPHYGHAIRKVGLQEMTDNIISAYSNTVKHLTKKGMYTTSRRILMYLCMTKIFTYRPLKSCAKKILQALGILRQ